MQPVDHMQAPVDITFRSMDPSPAVEESIKRWAARLDNRYEHNERCAVVIEVPHRRHRHGKTFQVHVCVTIPDRTIAITRDPGVDHRQLQDFACIRRGDVKLHA